MGAIDDRVGSDRQGRAEPPAWTDAEALIRAGWRSGPDLARELGISVRTLQRRAQRGEARRVQIGRETFYATSDIGARGDTRSATDDAVGGAFGSHAPSVERSGSNSIDGVDTRGASDARRHDMRQRGARTGGAHGAGDGVAALLDLVRELREALVDAERRAAVAAAERDALRATTGLDATAAIARGAAAGAPSPWGARPGSEPGSGPGDAAVQGAHRDRAVDAPAPGRDDAPAGGADAATDELTAEVHRLRGVVQRRTSDLDAARRRVESFEQNLARAAVEVADARRERDEARAEAAAARVARDEARMERDGAFAARDAAVAAHEASGSPGAPSGGVVVAGETIPFTDVEARMKQLVIERNEYRMQAKDFRDQRRQLEREMKRMRRSRNAGRRVDDAGWSKR